MQDSMSRPVAILSSNEEFDDRLVERTLRVYRWLRGYAKLNVEGLDQIPKGPAILVANHSGWAGLDYAFLALTIHDRLHRCPRVLVHPAWFATSFSARISRRLGLARASMATFVDLLDRGHLVVVFPEGEAGAFKQTINRPRYELQPFKDGFARAAKQTGAPVIPISITGGEEAFPTWKPISIKNGKRLVIPTPVSPLPLPTPWRIRIHPAVPDGVSDDFVGTVRQVIMDGCRETPGQPAIPAGKLIASQNVRRKRLSSLPTARLRAPPRSRPTHERRARILIAP